MSSEPKEDAPACGLLDLVARAKPVTDGINGSLVIGLAALVILIGGMGVWAATAELAGAVIASGTIVVDSNVKKVQHLAGGIVAEIRVRDGDTVAAGERLLRLDDTITRANLQIIRGQLDELIIRKWRLTAERDGSSTLSALLDLDRTPRSQDRDAIIANERAFFESRREAREGQQAQLSERIAQLTTEIDGLDNQQAAKTKEIELIGRELSGLMVLKTKDLTTSNRLTALERETARITGERAQLISLAAQAKGKIAETKLQIIQIAQDFRTEVVKELREIQVKEAELNERRIAAEDQLTRVEVRSPQAGVVHQWTAHTVGGVIMPGETITVIVPQGDSLVIEVRVAPQDIDSVTIGQPAVVRLPALNQRTTPELPGEVIRIGADLTREQQTGTAYFTVRVALRVSDLPQLGRPELKAGMPAEVHIQTLSRTAVSYLMKPLTEQFAKAFKD